MNSLNPTYSGPTDLSAFYNKVLGAFGLAILVTAAGVYAGFNYFIPFFISAPWLMWAIFALELILIFTSRKWSKIEPLNYGIFSFFAFLSGVTLVPLLASFASEFGSFDIIYKALFATTTTFIAAGLIGISIKKSLANWRGFLFVILLGMIIVGVLGMFFPWGNTGEMIYSGLGVMLFTAFAIYDVNRLKAYAAGDHYMMAAIALYLDIFNLFIHILRLMGALSRD
jgi:FtsH-binding integral membrane protein